MPEKTFETSRYSVSLNYDNQVRTIRVEDRYSGALFADGPYRYGAAVDDGNSVNVLHGCHNPDVKVEDSEEMTTYIISGYMGHPQSGIRIEHHLGLRKIDFYFDEQIKLFNETGKDLILRSYRFGFRKRLAYDSLTGKWEDAMARFRIIAIPFRI